MPDWLPGLIEQSQQNNIEKSFERAYEIRFGTTLIGQRVEAVNWRVQATSAVPASVSHRSSQSNAGVAATPSRMRESYFPDINGFVTTPVLKVDALKKGELLIGPALVEQPGSTVVIGPGDQFVLDEYDNIRISLAAKSGSNA